MKNSKKKKYYHNNKQQLKQTINNGKPNISESHNDPNWYNKYPALLRDAGKLSFNNPLGLTVSNLINNNETLAPAGKIVIPGIMRLDYLPTLGVSDNQASDVNTAARLIYSFVRHANSGSRNYESPDLMMYLLSASGLYSFYAFMVRAYGLTRVFSVTNRYVSKALLESMSIDYDDLVTNLADFRYYINYFATKANAFATPKKFSFYDRAATLPLHVFKDASDTKAQFYYFQPKGFYKFSGFSSETGSELQIQQIPGGQWDLQTFRTAGNLLLEAMISNEDVGIMSGDVLKAFGRGELRELAHIPEDYSTIPVYDKYMLTQIHNARIGNEPSTLQSFFVTQENGIIKCEPMLPIGSFAKVPGEPDRYNKAKFNAGLIPFIDFGWEDPSPEDIMEATRLQFTYDEEPFTEGFPVPMTYVNTCGTEIVIAAHIYGLHPTTGVVDQLTLLGDAYTEGEVTSFNVSIRPKSVFDWAPITYIFEIGDDDMAHATPVGEIFNYTLLNSSTLEKLHGCALLSLYEIPGMGALV